jgi:leucyl aminopeptidase
MLDIAFAPIALPRTGALVLFGTEGEPPALLAEADAATGGAVSRAITAAEWKGKSGQTTTVLAPGGGLSRVVLVGLGKGDLAAHAAEEAGGHAAAAIQRDEAATLATGALTAELAAHVAMGAVLRAWRFDRYRTQEKPEDKPKLAKITLLAADPKAAAAAWTPLRAVAEGVFLTREVVSEPPNVLTPAVFAERCLVLRELGVEVEVFGPAELAAEKFGALLGVAQGSANEPRMVVMRWHGGAAPKPAPKAARGRKAAAAEPGAAPLAFIGKGVTFDSGGISIKPAAGMEDMKWDMAGAGAVVGAMAAIAGRKAPVDVVGLIGLVENMPSGTAQRPGDVVTTASGMTVEIINTDAEGRMVLADVVHYAATRFQPRFMVDLATLTGAMVVSLGHEMAGMFANDDALADALLAAGNETGEKLWRMPLGEAYDKQLKSDIADMKHVTGRPGSAITAAHFIGRFAGGKPWAHLDVAGVVWSSKDAATIPKGATAFGVRLLDRLAAAHEPA